MKIKCVGGPLNGQEHDRGGRELRVPDQDGSWYVYDIRRGPDIWPQTWVYRGQEATSSAGTYR